LAPAIEAGPGRRMDRLCRSAPQGRRRDGSRHRTTMGASSGNVHTSPVERLDQHDRIPRSPSCCPASNW